MITKKEFQKVVKEKQAEEDRKVEEIANNHILQISNALKAGKFSYSLRNSNPKVISRVVAPFEFQGIKVEQVSRVHRTGKNRPTMQSTILRFSLE